MKHLFYIILIQGLLTGCNSNDGNIKYYFYETEDRCIEFIFELNGIKQSIFNWKGLPVEMTKIRNEYFESSHFPHRKYKEAYFSTRESSFDIVEMANSHVELRYDIMNGWLYNVRIDGKKWTVGLYMKTGTYKFEVTPEEHRIFNSAIHSLSTNLKDHYFPAGPSQGRIGFPTGSLYLNIEQDENETEYFTTLLSPECELNLLDQLVIMIIENNISPENKINNQIELLDIRQGHDSYVVIDSITGYKVTDYRLWDEPPLPEENP